MFDHQSPGILRAAQQLTTLSSLVHFLSLQDGYSALLPIFPFPQHPSLTIYFFSIDGLTKKIRNNQKGITSSSQDQCSNHPHLTHRSAFFPVTMDILGALRLHLPVLSCPLLPIQGWAPTIIWQLSNWYQPSPNLTNPTADLVSPLGWLISIWNLTSPKQDS